MKKLTLLSLCVWVISQTIAAQGTVADYNRAFLLQDKLKDKVFYSNVTPKWIGDTDYFWYVRNTPQGKIYVLTNAKQKKLTGLFDQNKLTVELTLETDKTIDANQLPVYSLKVLDSL